MFALFVGAVLVMMDFSSYSFFSFFLFNPTPEDSMKLSLPPFSYNPSSRDKFLPQELHFHLSPSNFPSPLDPFFFSHSAHLDV